MNVKELFLESKEHIEQINGVFPVDEITDEGVEFLITVMEFFDVEDLDSLKEKLSNFSEESAEKFVNFISEDLEEEISEDDVRAALENLFALKNTLDFLSDEDLLAFAEKINAYLEEISNEENENENEENSAEEETEENTEIENFVGEDSEENVEDDEAAVENAVDEENEYSEEENENEDNKEEEMAEKDKYVIIDPKEYISDTPQGKVDKSELRKIVIEAVAEGKLSEKDVNKIFGIVKCLDKQECLKYPIREFIPEKNGFALNINGLRTAALFVIRDDTSKNLTPEERAKLARQLLEAYKEAEIEPPEALKKLAKASASMITLDISESDLREYATNMEIPVEDAINSIATVEAILNDFYKKGILEIEDVEDGKNIIIEVNRDQLNKLINVIDNLSDNVIAAITGENIEEDGIVLNEIEKLRAELKEALNKSERLSEENEMLKAKIEELRSLISKKDQELAEAKLYIEKYRVLYDAVKNDEDYEHIISTLNEIASKEELKVFKKFTESVKLSKPKFKKKALISDDVEIIKNFIDNDNRNEEVNDDNDPVLNAI